MHEVVEEHRLGKGFGQEVFQGLLAVGSAQHPRDGPGPARRAEFLDETLEFEGVSKKHRIRERPGNGHGPPLRVQRFVLAHGHHP